jgi:hypothetical protein
MSASLPLAILLRFAKGSGFEGDFSGLESDYQSIDFNNQLGPFQFPHKKLALANLRRIAKA